MLALKELIVCLTYSNQIDRDERFVNAIETASHVDNFVCRSCKHKVIVVSLEQVTIKNGRYSCVQRNRASTIQQFGLDLEILIF